jgi:RNA recognition motif-containing protein
MNIYVGNIPYTVTEDEIRVVFERYGKVTTVALVIDRRTNRSRGYGFVEMPNDKDARTAIRELDGSDFHGRSLRVDQSQPRTNRRVNPVDRRMAPGGSRRQEDLAHHYPHSRKPAARNGGLLGFLKRLFGR